MISILFNLLDYNIAVGFNPDENKSFVKTTELFKFNKFPYMYWKPALLPFSAIVRFNLNAAIINRGRDDKAFATETEFRSERWTDFKMNFTVCW